MSLPDVSDGSVAGEEYSQVLNELIPYISDYVDQRGGLCSMSQLPQDPVVSELLNRIPNGYEKKVAKVLERYSDFFSLLAGGNIATFKGYEDGLVDHEGNIVKKSNKKNKQGTKSNPFEAELFSKPPSNMATPDSLSEGEIIGAPPAAAPICQTLVDVETKDEMGEDMTLMDALDKFSQTVFVDDNEEFMRRFQQLRRVRGETLGVDDQAEFKALFAPRVTNKRGREAYENSGHTDLGGVRDDPSLPPLRTDALGRLRMPENPRNLKEKEDRHNLVVREMLQLLMNSPTQKRTVMELTQHPKILALKKGVVAKFTTFIASHADKFIIEPNPEGGNKSDIIALIMPTDEVNEYFLKTDAVNQEYTRLYPELSVDPPAPSAKRFKKGFGGKGFGKK